MNKKIVITGMGAVTPVGIGVDAYWNALLAGKCGIDEIKGIDVSELPVKRAAEVKDFNPKDFLSSRLAADLDRFMQYAYVSAEEAINDSGIDFVPERTGIVMGTALHGLTLAGTTQEKMSLKGRKAEPKFLSKFMGNIAAAHLSINYNIKGPSFTVSTACSSGGDAVATAAMLIEAGLADVMVVMAGESAINPIMIQSLNLMKAISKDGQSLPFDKNRNGFVIGEGGGALILETEENALKRGANIKARLLGYANNADAYNPVAPNPEGKGAAECMRMAMAKADMKPEEIGYINTHGTATPAGDVAECKAIKGAFGDRDVFVGSTKGATGHLIGAGGITEAIACIKAVETGIIPPTVGCTEKDEACDANIVCQPLEANIKAAMSNALGFGGQNSCLIVGK